MVRENLTEDVVQTDNKWIFGLRRTEGFNIQWGARERGEDIINKPIKHKLKTYVGSEIPEEKLEEWNLNDPTQIVSLEQLHAYGIDIKPLKKEQDKLIYNYLLAKLDSPEAADIWSYDKITSESQREESHLNESQINVWITPSSWYKIFFF